MKKYSLGKKIIKDYKKFYSSKTRARVLFMNALFLSETFGPDAINWNLLIKKFGKTLKIPKKLLKKSNEKSN